MVKVVFPVILAKVTNGDREVTVSASSLKEALDLLVTKYGEGFKARLFDVSGQPKRFLNFYVNGKNVRFMDNLQTPLHDTDKLAILPSASGG